MTRRRDAGESLIELIIAAAILGTTMVTIIGGFLSLTKISGIARDQGKAFSVLTAASEYAKNRPCVRTASCGAEPAVPNAIVAHDSDTVVIISAPQSLTLAPGTSALTQFVVTVSTGATTLANSVVAR